MSTQPDQTHSLFLQQAIDLAITSARNQGGPFGAIVVKDGKIIGRGRNQVTENCDPSAHAEIMAIRDACKTINDFSLNDCTIYSSCEPCPMCLSAIYWARIPQVIFAATAEDAAEAGFDDQFIYDELGKEPEQRRITTIHMPHKLSNKSFEEWLSNESHKKY